MKWRRSQHEARTAAVALTSVFLAGSVACFDFSAAGRCHGRTDGECAANGGVDCVTGLWGNLEACDRPGRTSTGYPAGTALTATGSRTISIDDTVIDGERITGGLVIDAKNVTVRNSWITRYVGTGDTSNATGVITVETGASVTIERTTLDGESGTHACIWDQGLGLAAKGIECMNVTIGVFIWDTSNFTLEDSYFHDFSTAASNGSVYGFETEGASHGAIRNNVFDIVQSYSAGIGIFDSRANSDDILVERNLIAGAGFAVYAEDYSPSESSPAGGNSVTNIRFVDNRFSTAIYPCVGYWGVWYSRGNPTDAWSRTGNMIVETGENVDNGNPHVGDQTCN